MAKPTDKEWRLFRRPWEWPARVSKARAAAACPPINMAPALGTAWPFYAEGLNAEIHITGQVGNPTITWQDLSVITSRPYPLEIDEVIYADAGLNASEYYTLVYNEFVYPTEAVEAVSMSTLTGELRDVIKEWTYPTEAAELVSMSTLTGELRDIIKEWTYPTEAAELVSMGTLTGALETLVIQTTYPLEAVELTGMGTLTGSLVTV